MNLKGNLTSKGLQGSIGKSRMQGILGTNPAAIPISVDNQLSLSSTNPVQNKVITQAITNRLWSDEVKAALLQIVEKVAYIDADGQDYYDALYDALYPPTNLDSIGAVFDSSATIYNTDTLDDLKQYLTVTAYYTDGTSETVTTYTLSGSMAAGTQTITVSYGGKTTTFTVTIIALEVESIDAVFTQGSATIYDTDSLDTLKQYLVVTATYSDSTTAVVTDYTLSGTLTVGTSTITVSYGGKTDTFTATVSIGLDSVAYGTMTYRDIFVTNNKVLIGDFETDMTNDANFHTIGSSIYSYKMKMAGTPTRSTDAYNSYNHSLKAFGTSSQQMFYKSDTEVLASGSQYLVCAAVKVDRYVQGNVGVQCIAPINNSVDKINVALTSTTSGFEPVVGIYTMTATRTSWAMYIGTYTSANCDCYVDDVVVTPLPSGMTQAEGETLYANYLEIVGRAS